MHDGRGLAVPMSVDGFEERLIEPVTGDVGAEYQQQTGAEQGVSGPEKGQPKSLARERPLLVREGPLGVNKGESQGNQQRRGRGDFPEALRRRRQLRQDQQTGQRHAASEDVDEQLVAQDARGKGVQHADDQCGHPQVAADRDQPVGVVVP